MCLKEVFSEERVSIRSVLSPGVWVSPIPELLLPRSAPFHGSGYFSLSVILLAPIPRPCLCLAWFLSLGAAV